MVHLDLYLQLLRFCFCETGKEGGGREHVREIFSLILEFSNDLNSRDRVDHYRNA